VAALLLLLTGCASDATPTQGQRADVAHYVQSRLDAEWRGDGRRDRPPAVPTRFLLPNGWGFAMKECMVASGFTAFDYDRSAGFTNALERTSRAGEEGLAWYYCGTLLPTYDTIFSDLDEAQLDELYAYYTSWLIPCLALDGYSVLNVPTRAQFGDGGAGKPGSWNPYLTAELPASVAIASVVLEACEPYPQHWSSRLAVSP
jgi:hypothetical protein